MIVNKSNPLFRRNLKKAPGHPFGDRVLVRPLPVQQQSEAGLIIPDAAKQRVFAGILLSAGDQAADKLYDLGAQIGDEVWYAKYAGIIEEWQHFVGEDMPYSCPHDGAWDARPREEIKATVGYEDIDMTLKACRTCGQLKLTERVIIMATDDIQMNLDVQERFESGVLVRTRQVTEDGRTRYVTHRNTEVDSFEIGAL